MPAPIDPLKKKAHLFQLALLSPRKAQALDPGRELIGLLLAAGMRDQAVGTFKHCFAIDPEFRLAEADQVLPLAQAAIAVGEPITAIAALRGFDKKYPGHSLVPDVYVFSAKLMSENLGNIDMAKKILQHVMAKYPAHSLAQEARRSLAAMA